MVGKCSLQCQYQKRKPEQLEFIVVDLCSPAIIGLPGCTQMTLICRVASVEACEPWKKFEGVFQGTGCLTDSYHIEVDSSVKPVIHAPRKIPFALQDRVR